MDKGLLFVLLLISNQILCQDFSSQKYFNLKASEKMNSLWNKITEDTTPLGFYGHLTNAKIFLEDMHPSFEIPGDELLGDRKKYIHTLGVIAKFQWVNEGGHDYTGIFEGADQGLIRFSCAKKPDYSKRNAQDGVDNFVPGFSIKMLRNGLPSTNLVAMYGVNGTPSWNLFKFPFSNHIGVPKGIAFKALGLKFSTATDFIQTVGLFDFALHTQDGSVRTKPRYPFKLRFQPTPQVANLFPEDSNGEEYQDQWKRIPVNVPIYDVYAQDQPEKDIWKKVASIKLTSPVTTSKWGDESLFIRHTYMDIDIKDNPKWENYVPKFSIFGKDKLSPADIKACPYLSQLNN